MLCIPELVFLAEWWSESDARCYVNPADAKYFGKEHVLLIMNHTYEVDWLMGWLMADRCGTLGVSSEGRGVDHSEGGGGRSSGPLVVTSEGGGLLGVRCCAMYHSLGVSVSRGD